MTKIFTVVNQKGGVGKTTTSCNLSFAANEAGLKVLVVDFDTQGNTSQFLSRNLGIDRQRDGAERLFDLLDDESAELPIQNVFGDVWLLHGHIHLDELDRDPEIYDVFKLYAGRHSVKKYAQKHGFDYVIIDTPTALGPRQVAPMLWADKIVAPLEPAPAAMLTLNSFIDTIDKVKNVNHGLEVSVVINKIMNSKRQQENLEELRRVFGRQIVAELGNRVAVADSLADGESVWEYSGANRVLRDSWRIFTRNVLGLEEGVN